MKWRMWGRSVWHEINKFQLLGGGKRLSVVRAYNQERCVVENCVIEPEEYFIFVVHDNIGNIYCPQHSPYKVEIQ